MSESIELNNSKPRLYKYDNLRGLAMILVVLGHFMYTFNSLEYILPVGNMVSIICMPLLFFVSGYFSKIKNSNILKLFNNLMIPYIIFTIVWLLYILLVLGYNYPSKPFVTDYLHLWYLFSLFFMRLMLPVFNKIKHIFYITIVLGLIIGIFAINNNLLVISKTICFTAAFLLGYYMKNPEKFGKFINSKKLFFKKITENKYLLFIIFIAVLGIMYFYFSNWDNTIFEFKNSYANLDLKIRDGIFTRLLAIVSGLITTLFLTSLMTNKKTFLTKIGVNSLAIYIFHFYFVHTLFKIAKNIPYNHHKISYYFAHDPIFGYISFILLTVIVVFITSRDFFTNILMQIIGFFQKLIMNP